MVHQKRLRDCGEKVCGKGMHEFRRWEKRKTCCSKQKKGRGRRKRAAKGGSVESYLGKGGRRWGVQVNQRARG